MASREKKGNERKGWRFQQFEGWQCAGLAWGGYENYLLLEAQGSIAHKMFEAVKLLDWHGNVARLDAKFDVEGNADEVAEPQELQEELFVPYYLGRHRRKKCCRLTWGRNEGNTLEIGSRKSDSFFRYYNSSVKHPTEFPNRTYRAEWEVKQERARNLYGRLRDAADSRAACLSAVTGRMRQLGIDQQWTDNVEGFHVKQSKHKTDAEKRMAALERQWKSTIHSLILDGHGEELARRLGVKSLELR